MASGRFGSLPQNTTYIEAPAFEPAGGGILDKADIREGKQGDPAVLGGFRFESELPETQLGIVTNFTQQSATDAMTEGDGRVYELAGDPFTIYGAFALDTPGTTEQEARARAERRLSNGESLAVEKALWQTGGLLPTTATLLRSGAALKAKIAVGLLLEEYAKVTNGVPYFHGGRRVVNEVSAQQLLDWDAAEAQLKGGGTLINGAGYFAKTTIGAVTPTADQVWLYVTGRPVLARSPIAVVAAHGSTTFPSPHNREAAFALRTYAPALDGPTLAALVDLSL